MELLVTKDSTPVEVRTEWQRWLLSGEFSQAREVLSSIDGEGCVEGHCCLGVLEAMAVIAGIAKVGQHNRHDNYLTYVDVTAGADGTTDTESGNPTRNVRIWAGIGGADLGDYVSANDDYHRTFAEIAEVVVNNTPRDLGILKPND